MVVGEGVVGEDRRPRVRLDLGAGAGGECAQVRGASRGGVVVRNSSSRSASSASPVVVSAATSSPQVGVET
ncbi:hypothetical protein NJ76_19130 [Rhodococcus sp. IITR03]|nr:hypothetical protein NJ76_19130 [Rhodococcus sp. IITR03]